jgi:F0F1-type ATP synthase membrane subunit b/b'
MGTMVLALLLATSFAWGSESEELREKAAAIQREAAKLAAQGHREEATNLKRKAMAILEEAERLQHDCLDPGGDVF